MFGPPTWTLCSSFSLTWQWDDKNTTPSVPYIQANPARIRRVMLCGPFVACYLVCVFVYVDRGRHALPCGVRGWLVNEVNAKRQLPVGSKTKHERWWAMSQQICQRPREKQPGTCWAVFPHPLVFVVRGWAKPLSFCLIRCFSPETQKKSFPISQKKWESWE